MSGAGRRLAVLVAVSFLGYGLVAALPEARTAAADLGAIGLPVLAGAVALEAAALDHSRLAAACAGDS